METENILSDFEEDKLIQVHLRLKQSNINVLKSLQEDDISKAIRKIIDEYIKFKKSVYFEKYLTTSALGVIFVVFGLSSFNIFIQIAMYSLGAFFILYSLCRYFKGKMDFHREFERYG